MLKYVLLFLSFSPLLYGENGDAPPPSQNFLQPFMWIGIALILFYFILWRPEQKRRQALEQQRSSIKKGDQIVVAGILGEVHSIGEKTVIMRLNDGAKMEVLKGAIIEVIPAEEEKEGSPKIRPQ